MKIRSFYKVVKEILRPNSGISLVEIIIAGALVAGGGLVLMKGSDLLNESKDTQRSGVGLQLLNEDLMSTTTRMLSGVTNKNGKKVNGICSMVSTTAKAPGVDQIFITVNKGANLFQGSVWADNLTNWSSTNDSRCRGLEGWNKCFSFKSESINTGISAQKMEEMNIVASIEVIPVGMNPYKSKSGKLFYPLEVTSSTPLDAKDVSFRIVSKLYFTKNESSRVKLVEDFIWAPSVGTCDSTLANAAKTSIKLSLSGSGASDPSGRTVYNRSGFTGNNKDPVRVDWRRNVAQAGITLENGAYITTDQTKNIYGSCNEVTYKCPQVSDSKRTYGPLNMMLNMTFNSNSVLGNHSLARAKASFTISKGELASLVNKKDVTFSMDSSKESKSGEAITIAGSHSLNINVSEGSNSNQLCRKICRENTSYNTSGSTYTDKYSPYLKLDFYEFNKNFKFGTTQGLGCTACYMKNCAQFGLGTFGPMNVMPNQPQDAPVPECHRYEPNLPKLSPFYSMAFRLEGAPVAASSPKCVSAKIDSSNGRMIYRTETCDKKLPVMCFNYGQFLLARNVFGDEEKLAKVIFDDSGRRCFEMGREVTAAAKLHEFMGKSSLNIPKNSEGDYDFVNLASQGSFMAPQFQKDVEQFLSWMKGNGVSFNTWFWVPMVRDGLSHASFLPPVVPSYKTKDVNALFFNPSRSLTAHKYPLSLGVKTVSGENAFLLSHHIKFKGLIPAQKSSPLGNRKLSFLCRKSGNSGDFFISKEKGVEFSAGVDACKKDGGLFLPPNSTSQWITAYNLVNPFHGNFAFPTPSQKTAADIPLVWIALVAEKSASAARKAGLASSLNYRELGNSLYYTPDFSNDPHLLIDGEGYYKNPRALLEGSKIKSSDASSITIKDGDFLKYYVTGKGNEKVILNDSGTEIQMSLMDIVSKVNSSFKNASLKILSDGTNFSLKLIPKAYVANQRIKLMGGIDKEIGFKRNQEAGTPQSKYMCLKSDGKIDELNHSYKCKDGRLLSYSDISDSVDMQIAFNAMQFSKFDIFNFSL